MRILIELLKGHNIRELKWMIYFSTVFWGSMNIYITHIISPVYSTFLNYHKLSNKLFFSNIVFMRKLSREYFIE